MVIIRSRIGQDASPCIGIFIDCVLGFIFCVCCFVSDIKMTALLLSGDVDNAKKLEVRISGLSFSLRLLSQTWCLLMRDWFTRLILRTLKSK